jgi:murein DD-endopeptidase MepM/ murein hydrolase activator NlpD
MNPRNKVFSEPRHPYTKKLKKEIRQQTKNKLIAHPRNTTLFFSFVYVLAPLLFIVPAIGKISNSLSVTTSPSGYEDIITGKGGPNNEQRSTQREPISQNELALGVDLRFILDNPGIYAFEKEEVFGPVITITKTYNYLKVANTTLPVITPEVSSEYGWRVPPCDGCSADHKGVDFVPGNGTPVFAITDGMVIEMGKNGGYGNYIVLKHLVGNDEGIIEEWISLYAHLQNDSFTEGLKIGSVVSTGDTIAAVGNTGMSTGPHLHFELTINGENVDPLPLLGTYKVLIVSEEEYDDYMFVGEKIRTVTTQVAYE